MIIKSMNIEEETKAKEKQLFDIYLTYLDKYKRVYIFRTEEETFIFKSLGRKDFKSIFTNEQLDTIGREEVVCETCTLWPENYNFELCDAGLPTQYCNYILKCSHYTDEEEIKEIMNFYRGEMFEIQNQISCIIQEAFPAMTFEEIENLPMEDTLKYLSRSEWILQNLRGINMLYDPFTGKDWSESNIPTPPTQETTPQSAPPQDETVSFKAYREQGTQQKAHTSDFIPGETIEERLKRLEKGDIKKEPLTPEKLAELQRKIPNVDWTVQNKPEDLMRNIKSSKN